MRRTSRLLSTRRYVLALLFILLAGHSTAGSEYFSAKQQVLQSASELDYPPFAIVQQNGTAGGFSVDLLKAAAEAVGVSVSFKVGAWNVIKQELAEGKLDVLPLMSYSEERDRIYDFTTPYLRMNGTVFVRKNNTEIKNINDLKDKEVLVMEGDTAQEYAVKERLSGTIIPTVSYEEAFELLAAGKHDAVVAQQIVGLQLIKKLHLTNVIPVETKDITSLKPTALKLQGFEQKFCFAVPQGNQQLMSLLNEGLAIITLNGVYNDLYEKWFAPILPELQVPLGEQLWQIFSILIPLLLFLALLGLWYLKFLVGERTRHLELEIEQRKTVEAKLAEANVKYAEAQQLGKIGHWEYLVATADFACSAEAKRIFGFAGDADPVSLGEIERRIPERERVHQALVDLLELGAPYQLEYEIAVDENGGQRTVMSLAALIRDESGKPLKVVGVIQDITERRRAEMALQQSEEKFRTVADHIHDWEYWRAPDGSFVYMSPSCERVTGYSADEFLKDPGLLTRIIHPDDRRIFLEHLEDPARCRAQGECQTMDFRILSRNGEERRIEHICRDVFDRQGTYIGRRISNRDVTERKQGEEKYKRLQDQLQQAQKMEAIGTLAGGIAHDFNNILGAILGYAEMAREDCLSGSVNPGDLEQVIQAGNRAKDLVKQILAFSRQSEMERAPLRPASIIKESIKLLRSSLPTTVDIRQEIDPDAALVMADATQFHQIIMNLCTNAYHAMEETGGTLSISLKDIHFSHQDLASVPEVRAGQFVQMSVTDTGVGIAPGVRERIFDPYFTTKATGKGTGMGLAIVHGIVKSYGGFITCSSRIGEGTVFDINLPAVLEQPAPEQKADMIPPGTERVLLIDDEEILIKMGQTMLERFGYTVTAKKSSLEALTTFTNQPEAFDLVVTDQTMPGMTGLDLARRMLQIRPQLPIILCTGYSNQVSEEKAKASGIKGFILKPLVRNDFAALIRKVLDEGKRN